MPDASIDSGSSISRLNHHFNMLKTQFPQSVRGRDAPTKSSSSSSLRSSYFVPRISLRPTPSKSSTATNDSQNHNHSYNNMGNAKSKLSAVRRMHKSASTPSIRHVTEDPADSRAQTAVDNGPAKTSQPQLDHDGRSRGPDAAPRRAAKPALQQPPSEPQLFKTYIFSAKESSYDLYSLAEVSPHEESPDGMTSASTPTEPVPSPSQDDDHTNGIDIPTNKTSMHHVAERRQSITFAPEPFPRRSSIPRSETWASLTSRHSSVTFADLGFPRRDSQGNSETGSSFGSSGSDGIRKSHSTNTVFVPEPMLRRDSNASDTDSINQGRKWSLSSFRRSRTQSGMLPQVDERQRVANSELELTESRIRPSSPPHPRFKKHVGFDNVPNGETTKHNTTSLTLNVRHKGYQARRRSRLFMVGVDEHSYSDYAIQWLLDELVDDGDEIVCVRVIESGVRFSDRQYQVDANRVMQGILAKNGSNRAVSFVLEYAVGKLHSTFQKLIQMYQPAMLIVGTRGRSLGGIQGLVNQRNSFSKYCLQYSPVPVVVVRPTEKRIKKKVKRANDVNRQTYLGMLAATNGKHEADSEASSAYELEVQISPDEEASQVAKVLGLPAAFDPTIKPVNLSSHLRPRSPAPSATLRPDSSPRSAALESPGSAANSAANSEEEEDEEFEVMSGTEALNEQKLAQLHKMEKGEASALLRGVDDEDEEDEDEHAGVKLAS